MIIRKYTEKDISEMVHIWNEVVEDGEAFPQEEFLDDKTGAEFFASQTYWPLWSPCKCKLCSGFNLPWKAYR